MKVLILPLLLDLWIWKSYASAALPRMLSSGNMKNGFGDQFAAIDSFLPTHKNAMAGRHLKFNNFTCAYIEDNDWTFLGGQCACTEVVIDGIELAELDCGVCVGCANVSAPFVTGEVCQQQSVDYFFRRNGTSYRTDQVVTYDLPDGSSIRFEVITVGREGEPISAIVNGVPCVFSTTTCLEGENLHADCTASPFFDEIFIQGDCPGDNSENTTTPIALFFADYTPLQCLDINGTLWVIQTRGDPHITTFDGLEYDCQATGLFTLVTTDQEDGVAIQGLFQDAQTEFQATIMTGIVIKYRFSIIQVYFDDLPNSCDTAANLTRNSMFTIDTSIEGEYKIGYPKTFFEAHLTIRNSATFGCHMGVILTLPDDGVAKYFGLYGTPDGNPDNDWMDENGTPISLPADPNDLLFEDAYNYCVDNWCIQNSQDALFYFPPGETLADYNNCSTPYNPAIQDAVNGASLELASLCGGDTGCLVDGALGTDEDAQAALDEAEIFEEAEAEAEDFVDESTDEPSAMPSSMPSSMPSLMPVEDDECLCGYDVCGRWKWWCLVRKNCRRLCGCRSWVFSCS